ncbi:MAG TPA: 2-dehydropantoate 2-reductase [Candidatus Dormibacteraeota bacterium]|nr:2-dehydropantoate 2-reductase [Candidatus Dormibacteraeota bacterium]
MRHAILGAGGVGLLIGGALAQAGQPVLLILRPETLEEYPGGIHVESVVLGEFDVDVPAAPRLDRPVDVLWVTVKATQLEPALELASPAVAPDAMVVPLLNGIDHVDRLREVFGGQVIAGAIRVESEKVGAGHVVQASPFVSTDLGPEPALRARAEAIAAEMKAAGLPCTVGDGEAEVLWGKLALLAPFALVTSSVGQPIGPARDDPQTRALMEAAVREVCAVAVREGAAVDPDVFIQALAGMPADMRSSMQKDIAAGRQPELDGIAGPVLRRGRRHGIPTPAVEQLVQRIGGPATV